MVPIAEKSPKWKPHFGVYFVAPSQLWEGAATFGNRGRGKTQKTAKKFDMIFVGLGENAVSVDELEQRRVFCWTP